MPPDNDYTDEPPAEQEVAAVEVMCYCGLEWEEDACAIQCDECELWFHLACLEERDGVVILESELPYIVRWFCPAVTCKNKEEERIDITYVDDDEQDTRVFRQGRIVAHDYDERKRQWATVVYADAVNDDETGHVRADNVCMEEQIRYRGEDGVCVPWVRPVEKVAKTKRRRKAPGRY